MINVLGESHQAEQNQQEFVSVQCFHFCLGVAFRLDSSVVLSLSAAWASFSIPSPVRATD